MFIVLTSRTRYVIHNLGKSLPISFFIMLHQNLSRLSDQYRGKEDLSKADQSPKLNLLLWYFYGSLTKIGETLILKLSSAGVEFDRATAATLAIDLRDNARKQRSWRKKAEKGMAATRKTQLDPYSDKDEANDRLALLGIELGLISVREDQLPTSCASQSRRRILERQNTTVINPGQIPSDQEISGRINTTAPWELSCTNHHSRLALSNDPDREDEDSTPFRNNCLRFLTSSYVYIPSWDRSNTNAAALWWDLDASCVVCSTILDMRTKKNALDAARPEDEAPINTGDRKTDARRGSVAPPPHIVELEDDDEDLRQKPDTRAKKDTFDETLLDLLKRQLDQQSKIIDTLKKEPDPTAEFDWTRCKPPLLLHPDTWVQVS